MPNYLVISSDGHAGPPAGVYRDYLEEGFRTRFDEYQAELEAGRMVNTDFVDEWDDETGDREMRVGFDPAVRDAILDREGGAPEVLFPDADGLGTGRLGTVFAARLSGVEREYAVRVYRPEFADDPSVVRFFESDARALASIDHPACVPIFDAWREPGVAVLGMRGVTGGAFRDRVQAGGLPTVGGARGIERVGGALAPHTPPGRPARPAGARCSPAGWPPRARRRPHRPAAPAPWPATQAAVRRRSWPPPR